MAKIAPFIMIFVFLSVCFGCFFGVNDEFHVKMPDFQEYFASYLHEGLLNIKLAVIHNPIQECYDLLSDPDITFVDKAVEIIPTFLGSCVAFITEMVYGMYLLFVRPFIDTVAVRVNTAPYI